jgi:hypothetical protein
VVVALLVALALPLLGLPDPAASPSAGSPSPSPPADVALRIYTASEVSALAADPANDGRIVIMSLEADGFVAVRMSDQLVQIGSVTLLSGLLGGDAWTVADLLAYRGGQDLGLVPVRGWLVQTSPLSCPAPDILFDESESNDDLGYYCQGSWLSDEPVYTIEQTGTNNGTFLLEIDGALHVQVGAYTDFAPDPAWGERGAEPRHGIYLIRAAGCPAAVTGNCPVWEMVGRLEPPLESRVEPSPSAEASQDSILGAVAEWLAGEEWPFDDFVYVHAAVEEVGFLLHTYGPGARDPDLRDAGPPLFEGPVTDATIEAIQVALLPITAEFISDPAAVRQPRRQPGVCEPFPGERFMIQLGPPRPNAVGDAYFVTVQIGNGCHGWTKVVEVAEVDGDYRVTRVVIDGSFIVD